MRPCHFRHTNGILTLRRSHLRNSRARRARRIGGEVRVANNRFPILPLDDKGVKRANMLRSPPAVGEPTETERLINLRDRSLRHIYTAQLTSQPPQLPCTCVRYFSVADGIIGPCYREICQRTIYSLGFVIQQFTLGGGVEPTAASVRERFSIEKGRGGSSRARGNSSLSQRSPVESIYQSENEKKRKKKKTSHKTTLESYTTNSKVQLSFLPDFVRLVSGANLELSTIYRYVSSRPNIITRREDNRVFPILGLHTDRSFREITMKY